MEQWNLANRPLLTVDSFIKRCNTYKQAIMDLLGLCTHMNVTRDLLGYICFHQSPDTPPTYHKPWITVEEFAVMHSKLSNALTCMSADAREWKSLIKYLKKSYNDEELKPVKHMHGMFMFDNSTLIVANTASGGYHFMLHNHITLCPEKGDSDTF
jgi:hypothetical protein